MTSSLSLPKPFVRLNDFLGAWAPYLEKAFDRVWQNGLRYELLHMNAPPLLLRCISSFLSDRAVKVRILGHTSRKLRSTMVFPKEALSALFSSFFTCLNFLSFYPTLVSLLAISRSTLNPLSLDLTSSKQTFKSLWMP